MATVLDISLLGFLLPLFVFLFIFAVMLAILEKTQLFGAGNKTLNIIAAICVAAISVFIGNLTKLISATIPWIVFIAIILMFAYMIFKFYDSGEEFWSILLGEEVVFILILLIVFVGVTQIFESSVSPYKTEKNADGSTTVVSESGTTTTPMKEATKTLVHPRVLGALFMLIIAAIAVRFLVDKIEPRKIKK